MAQTITITAVPLDRHGYNISCFGEKDGAIDITVTGGSPPYKYDWSNGSTNEDVQDLPAGFYAVLVTDAIDETARIEVILTEPDALKPYIVPYEYPNGYNISCYNCYNGTLDLVPVGGATPYTYLWADGPTAEDRSLLGSDNYSVTVTDANGCTFKTEQVYLRAPDRSDWTMSGNVGTNPATQYLGTSDNKDAVFRTNNLERLRIKANGDVKLNSLMATGARLIYTDESGVLKRSNWPVDSAFYSVPWYLGGNHNVTNTNNRIGPLNSVDFIFVTTATERMRLTTQGRVGIGTNSPVDLLDIHHTDDRGGIRLTNDRTDANAHSEIRFMKGGTGRFALGCDFAGNGGQDFFLWDHVAYGGNGARRLMVNDNGDVGIGSDAPTKRLEIKHNVDHGGLAIVNGLNDATSSSDLLFAKGAQQLWTISCTNGLQGEGRFAIRDQQAAADRIRIDGNGRVLIGNAVAQTSPLYKLYVEGGIVSRDIKVTSGLFPDYVFLPGYRLLTISTLREFVAREGHLPLMPSAKEVEQNEGFEVGEMTLKLLRTVEEQALYIMELEERLSKITARLDALEGK